MSPIVAHSTPRILGKSSKINKTLLSSLILCQLAAIFNCWPIISDHQASSKWIPVKNFKSVNESANNDEPNVAESRNTLQNYYKSTSQEDDAKEKQLLSICARNLEAFKAAQQPEAAASILEPVNAVLRRSRELIDSVNEVDDYDDESDSADAKRADSEEKTAAENSKQQEDNNSQAANDEAALRREQEEIESREAEVADKLALDEQQQQQREIIQAQAESEAKAIKEQQEALLRQQKLQQQMLFLRNRSDLNASNSGADLVGSLSLEDQHKLHRQQTSSNNKRPVDIQFSDQQEDNLFNLKNNQADKQQPELIAEEDNKRSSDLLPAAQHHYGSHYGSLHGHQSHYYQFAESHKKGQFDSGFKRGGKKFKISGHASQHKSHAEGHVKWKGKKGKGVHYWDYKHKGKKHNHHHYY